MKRLGFSGKGSLFLAWLLAVSFLFGISPDRALANGTENLGAPSITIAPGSGVVTAGTGLVTQPGTININVDPGATINQVLLYWAGSGAPDNTIVVDGNAITGALIGGPTPASPVPSRTFRADITSLGLVDPGSNTLSVSGLNFGIRNDGAGILVIFDDAFTGQANAFSGEATVVGVSINLLGLLVLNTETAQAGPLPPTGGSDSDTVVGINLSPVLNAGTAIATTDASGNQSRSEATLQGLSLNVLNLITLGATAIRAEATAVCTTGGPSVSGESELANLNILGIPIPVAVPANTILNLGVLGSIALNEQISSVDAGTGEGSITVNAVHIVLLGGLVDIVLSSAHADIICDAGQPADKIISIRDGNDFAFSGSNTDQKRNTVAERFNFSPVNFARTADLRLFVADGEALRPDRIRIRVFRGTTVINTINLRDRLDSSDGAQWDSEQFSVPIPATATGVDVRLFSQKFTGSSLTGTPDSLAWVLAAFCLSTQDDRIAFSGRATVLRASVLNIVNVAVGDTGPLPPSGGTLQEGVFLNVPLLGLTSGTAAAVTTGGGSQSSSAAAVENLSILNLLGLGIGANVISATAQAQCDDDGNATASGNSVLLNLVINGQPITITGQPNQTINILGLIRIIINEQIVSQNNGVADITVNALHIIVLDTGGPLGPLADVVVASAHSDIVCP